MSEAKDFIFTEITVELDYIKTMDGMAAGTFISMWGDEVTFLPEELPDYIKNTQRVINSTKTESGQIVGLPIDQDAHDHAGGAGWIIGLELDEARSVIKFLVNWTEIGLDLIAKNIRRFFSPSVDIVNKVILGGSLTNYPASRNTKGQLMLRPIELSQSKSLKELRMKKTLREVLTDFTSGLVEALGGDQGATNPPVAPVVTANFSQPPAAPETKVDPSELEEISPALKHFLSDPANAEKLGELAEQKVKILLQEEKRKAHVVEFATTLAGGTKAKPFGLRVPPRRIIAVLLSLPEAQQKEVEKLLTAALDSAIDFAEHGLDSEGFPQRPQLPENIKALARQWVDGKVGTIKEFFNANPEIGKVEDFDVREFIPVKE